MVIISTPVMMQQQREPSLVAIESEDGDISLVHELPHYSDYHEQSMEDNNSMETPS